MTVTGRQRVVAYAPDLMDQSRIRALAADISFVRRAADLIDERADLVIIDLDRADSDGVASRLPPGSVGFAAHVDADRLEAARHDGIEALARSVFFKRLADLLG